MNKYDEAIHTSLIKIDAGADTFLIHGDLIGESKPKPKFKLTKKVLHEEMFEITLCDVCIYRNVSLGRNEDPCMNCPVRNWKIKEDV